MTTLSFKDFMENVLLEALHPELQAVVSSSNTSYTSKQSKIAKTVKSLVSRGEQTGLEGNMPKGSSRAYMKEAEPHKVNIDGKDAHMTVGTKVAIKSSLDKYHNKNNHDGHSLGQLQNRVENNDHFINSHYRILTEGDTPGHYKTNHDTGIFPPLIEHDHENHEYSRIGHCSDITAQSFRDATKTKTHPKGITHKDFCDALEREHHKANGRYWEGSPAREAHLDHVTEHPLVQKFLDHQWNTGTPPFDYRQKKNMGIFTHPVTGENHIVARDHGFDKEAEGAYRSARTEMVRQQRNRYY